MRESPPTAPAPAVPYTARLADRLGETGDLGAATGRRHAPRITHPHSDRQSGLTLA